MNEQTALVRKKIQNSLKGYETIQAYEAEGWFVKQYAEAHRRLNKLLMKQYWVNAAVRFLSSAASLTTVWVGTFFIAWFAVHGTMTTGQLIAFLLLIWNLHFPMTVIGAHYGFAQQAMGASKRVLELYNQDQEDLKEEETGSDVRSGYDLVLQHVTFRHAARDDARSASEEEAENGFAIRDLNLEIKAGSVVALIGENGSGKSTVARICAGLLAPDEGMIFIRRREDGASSQDIASHVALVPQQPFIFTASIAENIRLGREDAAWEDMVKAAKTAQAHGFIVGLEDGYDTRVDGNSLSGGEKQRIALARALLTKRPILILDEATSALDNETEAKVMAGIREYAARNGTTVVLIAHKWSVVEQADEIYAMDRGAIAERRDFLDVMKSKAGLAGYTRQGAFAASEESIVNHGITSRSGRRSAGPFCVFQRNGLFRTSGILYDQNKKRQNWTARGETMRFRLPLRLDDIQLRNKMLIVYFFCVLFPIVLTNAFFYQMTTNNVRNQRMEDISRALEQVRNDFRAEVDAAVRVSDVFISDYILNDILETEYENPVDYVDAYDSYFRKIINIYTPLYASMQNIKIYLDNPTLMHSGAVGHLTPEVRESDWYRELSASDGLIPVLLRTVREHVIQRVDMVPDTFVIVRRMNQNRFPGPSKWEKIIKIEIRPQAVEQVFSNLNLTGHLYLLDESGQVEYSTNPDIDWVTQKVFYQDLEFPEDTIQFETVYSDVSYLNGWKLIGVIPEEEVLLEVQESRDFILWLALINLLLSTAIIYWVTRSMNVRLVNILRHMKKVKNQQFLPIEARETRDEIGQLQNEFNRMTLQIKSLIQDVYIADIRQKSLEIERRKAQFNALQSQINPHFLFNSLETIRMRSLIKNETETAQIIHNMAKLLRSSLTWTRDMIRVEEELEFIHCFLEIQKYRFGDRLAYRIEVDPEARDLTIPKMVFLPFVENASIHGIEPMKGGGEIEIAIRCLADGLEFSIRDNGVGMRPEQVERIYGYLKNETEELGERIGVQNVLYRLRMLYGDSIRLFIDSAPGRGTHIRIMLPVKPDADGSGEALPGT